MGTRLLSPDDPAYPPALADLAEVRAGKPRPPLHVRGRLPPGPGVAIVGTRSAREPAAAFARALAHDLAALGIAIWSGGAVGIDAAAHEGALDAGGVTVVVAGGGLDRAYPPEHEDLFARVLARGGALVARAPDGERPRPFRFLQRNEVLAALTRATVVVEAGLASGARSTAAAARRLGRPLCVVPHAPWDPGGAGCALELARGARAVISARDVISALGSPPPVKRPRSPARSKRSPACARLPLFDGALDPDASAVLAALGPHPIHVDEACERAGLPLPVVTGALLTLTLQAVVVEGPAGFFRRAARL